MDHRLLCFWLALALTACVPFRETTYDAVHGIQNPAGPGGGCPRDRYRFGDRTKIGVTMSADLEKGTPKVSLIVSVWTGHTFNMSSAEIVLESLQKPSTHSTLPLTFYECPNGNRAAKGCISRTPPFVGPPRRNSFPQIEAYFADVPVPKDFVDGFTVSLAYSADGTELAEPVAAEFVKVTRFVSRGPYGCE